MSVKKAKGQNWYVPGQATGRGTAFLIDRCDMSLLI